MNFMKLKAVIIGCGNIAGGYDLLSDSNTTMTHAKAYKNNPNVETVGAFDVDLEKAQRFCKIWNISKSYSDLKKMLADCSPDIVSICSPNETHFEIFQTVVGFRPKGIICEKPMAMFYEQALKMVKEAEEKKIALAVNYIRRWDSSFTSLHRRIQGGEFGSCQLGRVLYTKGLFHNASHAINLMQSWLGEVNSIDLHRVTEKSKDDVLADFSLGFKDCPQIIFQGLNTNNYNYFEIDLHFTKARISIPKDIHVDWAQKSSLVPGTMSLGGQTEIIPSTLHTAVGEVVNDIVRCILTNSPLKMYPIDACKTIQVCEQIRNSKI